MVIRWRMIGRRGGTPVGGEMALPAIGPGPPNSGSRSWPAY